MCQFHIAIFCAVSVENVLTTILQQFTATESAIQCDNQPEKFKQIRNFRSFVFGGKSHNSFGIRTIVTGGKTKSIENCKNIRKQKNMTDILFWT